MLKVFNTLGRELQEFKPIESNKVNFYQCGPTVYSTQHIGNMRAMVMADLVRRSLLYLGYDVKFARNYTDVGHLTGDNLGDADAGEDRMEKGAKKEGLTPLQIAQKYIDQFEQDTKALNTLEPDVKPRATEYVDEMIEMVEVLLEKGFAYSTPNAIYFDITKAPDYAELSGQKLDLNQQGAGHGDVDDTEHKRHPADFAVWFFRSGVHKNALQYWESPFESPAVEKGYGFPGWHIECSAMTKAELGETLDIHMGGVEHVAIHHPNEIAQSESANGVKFVNYWMHNEHLLVDGGKMSKSEGTAYYVSDIVEKGFKPLDLRYFFLQAHYRSQQNFTWEALTAAQTAYKRIQTRVGELILELPNLGTIEVEDNEFRTKFRNALEDDFNIPQALAVTWDVLKSDLDPVQKLGLVLMFDQVLGLELETSKQDPHVLDIPEAARELIEKRLSARAAKDWAESDRLRDELRSQFGLEVKDGPQGQMVSRA